MLSLESQDGLAAKTPYSGGDKETICTRSVYSDLQFDFESALRRVNRVVVSGFGWGDQGITNRVVNWLERDEHNRLLLLHEGVDSLDSWTNALEHIGSSFREQREAGRFLVHNAWMSDTAYSDIAALLKP